MSASPAGSELIAAARALAASGLVDAFGHISARAGEEALITPARPLGELRSEQELLRLPLGELDELPAGVPKEGWIHWAIYRRRPDVTAVCRGQPPSPLAVGAVTEALPALHGQGALLGASVPVFDDARLVRGRARGEALAERTGDSNAMIMRGNGAIALGASPGHAVARMALLERAARVYLDAAAAGEPKPLRPEEVEFWQATGDELLDRLWAHLDAG